MIAFFPEIYPDELLYSQLARYHSRNGYVRYVFSALERNNDSRAEMKSKQRKDFLLKIYKSDLYGKLSPYMTWGGLSGIMAKSLKNKRTFSCLTIAKTIRVIKKFSPKLFSKIS